MQDRSWGRCQAALGRISLCRLHRWKFQRFIERRELHPIPISIGQQFRGRRCRSRSSRRIGGSGAGHWRGRRPCGGGRRLRWGGRGPVGAGSAGRLIRAAGRERCRKGQRKDNAHQGHVSCRACTGNFLSLPVLTGTIYPQIHTVSIAELLWVSMLCMGSGDTCFATPKYVLVCRLPRG